MKKRGIILTSLGLLGCFLAAAGCEDKKTAGEPGAAKSELAEVKAGLQQTQKDKDVLKADAAKLAQTLEETRSELALAVKARDKFQAVAKEAAGLKKQVSEVTKERDRSVAEAKKAQETVSNLRTQLQQQARKLNDIQDQNKELQAKIQKLQKKLEEGPTSSANP